MTGGLGGGIAKVAVAAAVADAFVTLGYEASIGVDTE
jgi:hypothetical protein